MRIFLPYSVRTLYAQNYCYVFRFNYLNRNTFGYSLPKVITLSGICKETVYPCANHVFTNVLAFIISDLSEFCFLSKVKNFHFSTHKPSYISVDLSTNWKQKKVEKVIMDINKFNESRIHIKIPTQGFMTNLNIMMHKIYTQQKRNLPGGARKLIEFASRGEDN